MAFGAKIWKTHRLLVAQLVLMGLMMTSCGTVTVRFVSNPQVPPSSTTGLIVAVFVGTVSDIHGNPLVITTVNLVNAGLSSTLNLCGDQQHRFVNIINSVARIDFT